MMIYPYKSYEEYLAEQIKANKAKIGNLWVHVDTIEAIAVNFPRKSVSKVICHGTRNGTEMEYFLQQYPLLEEIIGTEISDTADKFEHTVQHDFHEEREEWVGQFDIVYSNSLDHSYDPVKALTTWTRQLNPGGALCVELMLGNSNVVTPSDPLSINDEEYLEIIKKFGHVPIAIFKVECNNSESRCYVSRVQKK